MFTEEDYLGYFNDLQNAEKKMIVNIDKILYAISDDEIKAVLSSVRNDEIRHLKLEDKLLAILESHDVQI